MKKFLYIFLLLFLCTTPAEASGTALGAIPTTTNVYTAAQADAAFQPLDSDLTSIAALSTTSFGRGLLDDADLTAALDTVGSTRGSILERGSSAWVTITPGTSGHVFTSNGAGADPTWQAATSGAPTSAKYLTLANDGTLSAEQVVYPFPGRLRYSSTTVIQLDIYLSPFPGSWCEVNGEAVSIPQTASTSDNRITNTATDAGAALTTNTVYYAYLSNSLAPTFPSDLRLSTQVPSQRSDGIYYLGTTGDTVNWRYCGLCRTNGSTQFVDSTTQRFICSHYHKIPTVLYSSPGYNDNNAATSYTHTNTTWGAANAGTGSKIEWVNDVGNTDFIAIQVTGYAQSSSAAGECYLGIGYNSTSTAKSANLSFGTTGAPQSSQWYVLNTVGYNAADLLAYTNTGTMTVRADWVRGGSASDPAGTYITAFLKQ